MANKTIHGCFNTNTGVVTFEGEACDSGDYIGCYVADGGIHDGQIAVVVSEANCDDTYYACFEPTTGQFSLSIPDDCCTEPCVYCGENETPKYLTITLDGLTLITDCTPVGESYSYYYTPASIDINGTYLLTQKQEYTDNCSCEFSCGNCCWQKALSVNYIPAIHYFILTECEYPTNPPGSLCCPIVIKVGKTAADNVDVDVSLGGQCKAFEGSYTPIWGCMMGGCINDYEGCFTGGSATILEGDQT